VSSNLPIVTPTVPAIMFLMTHPQYFAFRPLVVYCLPTNAWQSSYHAILTVIIIIIIMTLEIIHIHTPHSATGLQFNVPGAVFVARDRQFTYKHNIERVSVTIVAVEKQYHKY